MSSRGSVFSLHAVLQFLCRIVFADHVLMVAIRTLKLI